MFHLIIFEVGSRQLAIKAENVIEIIRAVEVTAIPHAELPFVGVINYRGQVVPVVRVSYLLGLNPALPSLNEHMIIVSRDEPAQLCLVVDQVVAFAATNQIQPLADFDNYSALTRLRPTLAKLDTALVPVLTLETLNRMNQPV